MKLTKKISTLGVLLIAAGCGGATMPSVPDPRNESGVVGQRNDVDPGCTSTQLVSTDGPQPRNPSTLAIRWTGFANFELAYKGKVILLDTYFDRGSFFPPLGFKAADVKRADLILIGHGHVDHMSDAASVGARTGAPVMGAPVTIEKLRTQNINPSQLRSVHGRGGEELQFANFKVEPILGLHGQPPQQVVAAFRRALNETAPKPSSEQVAELKSIRQLGVVGDQRVITEGTIAFLITLDNGFRIMFRDSGGRVTDYEKAAMERIGGVDVALVAVSASFIQELTIRQALEHAGTYRPDVYIPSHHDASFNNLWRATEPLFQALKAEHPKMITVSRGYREPVCFDTENNILKRKGG